jgi:redox-sensing transcriptional repressor
LADGIPDIVIGRLPVYLRALTRMVGGGGKTTTSSHELGQLLGISSAQIRKDLSHFGEFGKQGTGYHIEYLIEQLQHILNLEKEWPVALIGAGYLGHALAHYHGFKHRGFRIAVIFDSDPAKVGEEMSGLIVRHTDELEEAIQAHQIKMAILAVPAGAAQEITDRITNVTVKAILNYAPINLAVPPDVQVSYADPVIQLQRMTYYLG